MKSRIIGRIIIDARKFLILCLFTLRVGITPVCRRLERAGRAAGAGTAYEICGVIFKVRRAEPWICFALADRGVINSPCACGRLVTEPSRPVKGETARAESGIHFAHVGRSAECAGCAVGIAFAQAGS